jgi:hypothetical protein
MLESLDMKNRLGVSNNFSVSTCKQEIDEYLGKLS